MPPYLPRNIKHPYGFKKTQIVHALKKALPHENVWATGDIAPSILNLATRLRCGRSVWPRGEITPGTHLKSGWVAHNGRGGDQDLCPLREPNPDYTASYPYSCEQAIPVPKISLIYKLLSVMARYAVISDIWPHLSPLSKNSLQIDHRCL
jgi:hypothetical protein